MKYRYVGTSYVEGLPANDIDDASLSDAEKALLAEAVKAGLYVKDEHVAATKDTKRSMESSKEKHEN